MALIKVLFRISIVSFLAVLCVGDLHAQNYLCNKGFCDLEVLDGTPDTLIVFSGTANQDYYVDLRRYIPKNNDGIDREQLRYVIQSQRQLDGSPTTLFSLNLPASNLLWTDARAGDSYEVDLEYFEDGVLLGNGSVVIRFDTSAPRFDYDVHADTLFIGTKLEGADTTRAKPINVAGADSILYRIQDTIYRSTEAGSDGTFADWLRLTDSGHVVAYDAPQRAGTYAFYTRVYKSYNGIVEDRLDESSLDSIVFVVVDTPIIRYNDVERVAVLASSADRVNLNEPTLDLRGIPYEFSVASVQGTVGRTNASSASYSVDPLTGIFRDDDPAFGSNINSYIFTIRASTNRYGGQEIEKTFRYNIIDTPLVGYPSTASIFDYEHDYTGTRDSIMLPTELDWRQDTGLFHLVEVRTGYRDLDNNFVEQSRTLGNRTVDAVLPVGIAYDSDSAKISWSRSTPGLEYQFKVLVSNNAGLSPKVNGAEDTARFTLVIRPGAPTITYAPNTNETTLYGQQFLSSVPQIDWKGTPVALRRDSVALIEFSGSIDRTTYGTDTEQSRIEGLQVALPVGIGGAENANAGQLELKGGDDYPKNMRVGMYRLDVFVWNAIFPNEKGSGLDTIQVTPANLLGFEYRVNAPAAYDHLRFWRALSYNDISKYEEVIESSPTGERVLRFDGEDIDSVVSFSSSQSGVYTFLDSDGGDTVSYRILRIERLTSTGGTMAAPIFEAGFTLSDRKLGFFNWDGSADAVEGNLASLSSASPEDGVSYRIIFEATNGVGSLSHTMIFEVFRPTPKLRFTEFPLTTFYFLAQPIGGITRSDTTIAPRISPKTPGMDINGKSWYSAPGRDAEMASYDIFLTQRLIDVGFVVDTLSDIDEPVVVFPSTLDAGLYATVDIEAVNQSGTHSITPAFGVVIIDTPRNQAYTFDTVRVDCGFDIDSNYIDIAASFNRTAAGWDFNEGRYGLAHSILRIDAKLPEVDHDAIRIVNAGPYADPTEEAGKVYFDGKKDDRDVFPVDTFDVWIKVTNSLTRGELNLPTREGAYDSVLMVLVVRGTEPELTYSELNYESFFSFGGSSPSPQIDWGCDNGTYRLIDTANQGIQNRLRVDATSGIITWDKDLPMELYTFKVVAQNVGGSDTTSHMLRINIAPPSDYIYTPNTLTASYGKGGTSHLPSINWHGNEGNYAIASLFINAVSTTESLVSIDALTGAIRWKENIPVGTYNLEPSATNAGGTAITTFTLVVEQSKPSIDYLPSTSTVVFGASGSSVTPIVTNGGASSVTHTIIPVVEGVTISEQGVIEWSGATAAETYQLESIVNNGLLTDTALYTLIIEKSDVDAVGVNTISEDTYTLFPNPIPRGGSATLRFGLAQASVVHVSIINLHGETVLIALEKGLLPGDYDIPISVGNLVGGMYLLEIRTEQGVHRRRIVITQ